MRGLAFRHILRRAGDDNGATGVAALGTEIDDVIGRLDHERGTHEELMTARGMYYEMVLRQAESAGENVEAVLR
jgi:hypothetical protein